MQNGAFSQKFLVALGTISLRVTQGLQPRTHLGQLLGQCLACFGLGFNVPCQLGNLLAFLNHVRLLLGNRALKLGKAGGNYLGDFCVDFRIAGRNAACFYDRNFFSCTSFLKVFYGLAQGFNAFVTCFNLLFQLRNLIEHRFGFFQMLAWTTIRLGFFLRFVQLNLRQFYAHLHLFNPGLHLVNESIKVVQIFVSQACQLQQFLTLGKINTLAGDSFKTSRTFLKRFQTLTVLFSYTVTLSRRHWLNWHVCHLRGKATRLRRSKNLIFNVLSFYSLNGLSVSRFFNLFVDVRYFFIDAAQGIKR